MLAVFRFTAGHPHYRAISSNEEGTRESRYAAYLHAFKSSLLLLLKLLFLSTMVLSAGLFVYEQQHPGTAQMVGSEFVRKGQEAGTRVGVFLGLQEEKTEFEKCEFDMEWSSCEDDEDEEDDW